MVDNGQNWRPEIDATDYFGNQQKKLQVADRRPVIRKASDLVGPGINANAVRITDFNNQLATYDGFFSAESTALFAPNNTEDFVGVVISDATLGGTQTFTGLTSGNTYQRAFTRNPSDDATIYWGSWEFVGSGTGGGGLLIETLPMSIFDAKGDLLVGTGADAGVRKAVGADGTSLVADSTATTGVKWMAQVQTIVEGDNVSIDFTDPQNPVINGVSGNRFINTDQVVVGATGDQTITLSYIPIPGSLHVYWNGQSQPPTQWTLVDNIVTIPDPDGFFAVGHVLSTAYAVDVDADQVAGIYDAAVLSESTLLAFYRLAETSGLVMTDSSGFGRHGVYTSDVVLGETAILSSDPDTAAGFHGPNARGVVAHASWMDVPAFTIECWIDVDAVSSGILALPNRDTNARSWQWRVDSGGNIDFTKLQSGTVGAIQTATLDDMSRHYAAATYDGSFLRQFVDGAQVGSAVAMSGDMSTLADLAIGATYAGDVTWWAPYYFKGKMSKVAYYSGAQSAASILNRWQIGTT